MVNCLGIEKYHVMKSSLLGEERPLSIENSNTFYFIEGNAKVVSAVWLISQVSILCTL